MCYGHYDNDGHRRLYCRLYAHGLAADGDASSSVDDGDGAAYIHADACSDNSAGTNSCHGTDSNACANPRTGSCDAHSSGSTNADTDIGTGACRNLNRSALSPIGR